MRNALDHILEHLDCCDNEDNDRLQAALAELRRLRAIEAGYAKAVEEAYHEGWSDGEREGLSAGQSWSGVRFGRSTAASDYETSNAKRALEPKP